jgi:hypothetical protein
MPINPAEAVALAQANASALAQHLIWAPAFLNVTADPHAWRVQLTDVVAGQTPLYYLVTFRRLKPVTARMAIHADTGKIREIRGIQAPGSQLIEFVDPLSTLPPLPAAAALSPHVDPDLYWRPSRASTSLIDPFFVVDAAGRKVYVRVDGRVYYDLNVVGHG